MRRTRKTRGPRGAMVAPGGEKTAKRASAARAGILAVQILEAKPNTMFTEEQRAAVRFLRFNQWVPCKECGRRRKVMWTMLCEFYAHSMGKQFGIEESIKKHQPLEGVCRDHLLAPAWPEKSRRKMP